MFMAVVFAAQRPETSSAAPATAGVTRRRSCA